MVVGGEPVKAAPVEMKIQSGGIKSDVESNRQTYWPEFRANPALKSQGLSRYA
jgi:hypothetical protein